MKKSILTLILFALTLTLTAHAHVIDEAYLSISLRTPKDQAADLIDYEYRAGLALTDYIERIDGLYERENDEYYTGLHGRTVKSRHDIILLSDWQAEVEIREAYGRHEAWLYKGLLDLIGDTQIRMSARWERWEYEGLFLGITTAWRLWENVHYEGSLDTNFDGTTVSRHNILARADITRRVFNELRIVRHVGSDIDTWQVKTEVGYKF